MAGSVAILANVGLLLNDPRKCFICHANPKGNHSTIPCGHAGCLNCIKQLGIGVVDGSQTTATCPGCGIEFLAFLRCKGHSYTFYLKNFGPNGKLKNPRRVRVRRRRKRQNRKVEQPIVVALPSPTIA